MKLLSSADRGALLRVIAGGVGGYQDLVSRTHRGPHACHAGARRSAPLPWNPSDALAYVLAAGAVGTERRHVRIGKLVAFGPRRRPRRGDGRPAGRPGSPLDILSSADSPSANRSRSTAHRHRHQGIDRPGVRDFQAAVGRIPAEPAPIPAEPSAGRDVL